MYQSQQCSKSLSEIRPEIFHLCWMEKPTTIKPSRCGLCQSWFDSMKPLSSVDFSDRNGFFFSISLFSWKRRYSGGTEWYYVLTQKSYLNINYNNFTMLTRLSSSGVIYSNLVIGKLHFFDTWVVTGPIIPCSKCFLLSSPRGVLKSREHF